jgi:hypothetical protein
MTNIAKAIDRLREERRDAQNQVQKLGEAISVLERLTRVRAQRCTRGYHVAPSAYSPPQDAGEFLWPRKHAGLRSGR